MDLFNKTEILQFITSTQAFGEGVFLESIPIVYGERAIKYAKSGATSANDYSTWYIYASIEQTTFILQNVGCGNESDVAFHMRYDRDMSLLECSVSFHSLVHVHISVAIAGSVVAKIMTILLPSKKDDVMVELPLTQVRGMAVTILPMCVQECFLLARIVVPGPDWHQVMRMLTQMKTHVCNCKYGCVSCHDMQQLLDLEIKRIFCVGTHSIPDLNGYNLSLSIGAFKDTDDDDNDDAITNFVLDQTRTVWLLLLTRTTERAVLGAKYEDAFQLFVAHCFASNQYDVVDFVVDHYDELRVKFPSAAILDLWFRRHIAPSKKRYRIHKKRREYRDRALAVPSVARYIAAYARATGKRLRLCVYHPRSYEPNEYILQFVDPTSALVCRTLYHFQLVF